MQPSTSVTKTLGTPFNASCIPYLLYTSHFATLLPGEVIVTGTPGGVGFKRQPRVFLKPGDTIEVDIEGIGTLTNPVVADRPR
jgi:2-keto-4-pentenoate hydratase/2-oxohepta-3-ene-1,7-dioic acid hydratase in catechol pathway